MPLTLRNALVKLVGVANPHSNATISDTEPRRPCKPGILSLARFNCTDLQIPHRTRQRRQGVLRVPDVFDAEWQKEVTNKVTASSEGIRDNPS